MYTGCIVNRYIGVIIVKFKIMLNYK